jgi:hypothetical protein
MVSISTIIHDRIIFSVASGLLAALLSYCLNSKVLKNVGEEAITFWAPALEELLKTGFALVLGGGVILSHVTFGVVEAFNDIRKNRSTTAYLAGVASLVSHSAFGAITQYFIYYLNSCLFGLSIAIIFHVVWNYTVVNLGK